MKNIVLILCLIFISIFPNYSYSDHDPNQIIYLVTTDNVNLDNGILGFSYSEKVVKSSSNVTLTSFIDIVCSEPYINSFVSVIKINDMLMTIKYGSTLILLS